MELPGFLFIFISFSCLLSFLFAAGYTISPTRNVKVKRISWSFFLIGIFLFHYIYLNTKLFLIFPYLYLYNLPILFLFGPLVNNLIYMFMESEKNSWLKSKIHYLPFILASFYMIYEMVQISDVRLDRILYLQDRLNHQIESDKIFQVEPIVKFLSIAGSLHLSFYVLQPGFELVRYFRLEILQRVPSIRFLSILLATIACANLGALLLGFFESQFGLEMGLFFLSCIPPLIYLIHSVYPTLFDELRDAIQEEKRYKNSQLKNINLDDLHLKIQSLLKSEKIYLEEGLKLNIVADKLQITPHQLSEYINTQTGKTYQNWLNGYRIDHACFLLIEKPDWAIIRIAFESGFSSKSSFQDAFKKEMGITPSEYRKSK